MDLKSRFVIVAFIFHSMHNSLSQERNENKINSDDVDEFNVFVQTFLDHLLNADAFTRSEKEDLKAIVETVETVIAAPRRRGTDLVRKMQIFNVAVVSAIAETVGAESDNLVHTRKKASAIARALTFAFKTVSTDSRSNQQLISEVSSMVNMFARLEQQGGLDLDTSLPKFASNLTENLYFNAGQSTPDKNESFFEGTTVGIPLKSNFEREGRNVFNENSTGIRKRPTQNEISSFASSTNISPKSAYQEEWIADGLLGKAHNLQDEKIKNGALSTPDSIGSTNWNFVFCLYNELFSSNAFTNTFKSSLPYHTARYQVERISSGLSNTLFQTQMSEYDISRSLTSALLYLSPDPTTEEFAFMFGHELSKLLISQGMLQGSDPCKLSSSVAAVIIQSISRPFNRKANDIHILKRLPPGKQISLPHNPIIASETDLVDQSRTEFEHKLLNHFLSSENIYAAFPIEITYEKLKDYAYAIGSFIPAIPEFKSLNNSILSAALADNLKSIQTPASAYRYAASLASVITIFLKSGGLLDHANIDEQATHVGNIALNALSTQITPTMRTDKRKSSKQRNNPRYSKILNNTLDILPILESKVLKNLSTLVNHSDSLGYSIITNGLETSNIQTEEFPIHNTSSNDIGNAFVTYPNNLSESYNITSEGKSSVKSKNPKSTNDEENSVKPTDLDAYTTDLNDLIETNYDYETTLETTSYTGIMNTLIEVTELSHPTAEYGTLTPSTSNRVLNDMQAIDVEKETAIGKIKEEMHRAEKSGETEIFPRALAVVVSNTFSDATQKNTKEVESCTDHTHSIDNSSDVTGLVTESMNVLKIKPTEVINSSELSRTTSALSNITEIPSSNSTFQMITYSYINAITNNTSKGYGKMAKDKFINESRKEKLPKNIPQNPFGGEKSKDLRTLEKSHSWLFESALSYSLLSSEKFTVLFKPKTIPSDAKSFAFTMAESVSKLPSFNFTDSVFIFGHAYYSAVQHAKPNKTAEEYAKAFAKATGQIALEKRLMTKANQISLAISIGNAIHDSLSSEQPHNFKIHDQKRVTESFEMGEDESTSAFLEELLSTLSNSDAQNRQKLLSQTLSDIGTIIGNRNTKPKTLLIKLLIEALVAAVNVIISSSSK